MDCYSFMLLDIKLCMSVLTLLSCHNIPCEMPGDCLKAVADAEDRNIEFENSWINDWSTFFIDRIRSTREDDSCCP